LAYFNTFSPSGRRIAVLNLRQVRAEENTSVAGQQQGAKTS